MTLKTLARVWTRRPLLAGAMMATMTIGFGVAIAVFSVARGVLLRPLPYAQGERAMVLHQPALGQNGADQRFSAVELADYRARVPSIESLIEQHTMYFILLGHGDPERVATSVVSYNFFSALGIRPQFGRDFTADDDKAGADAVLILSNTYWHRRFGGDPHVVGQVYQMNDRPHTIVGVLPDVPLYPAVPDVYMTTSSCPFRSSEAGRTQRGFRMVTAIAIPKPGVPAEQLRADAMTAAEHVHRENAEDYPEADRYGLSAEPLRNEMTKGFDGSLNILLAAGALILLIACASVANLVLARAAERRRELATRHVLGAGTGRIAMQLLGETLLLSGVSAAGGLLVGVAGSQLLKTFAAGFTTTSVSIGFDWQIAAFAAAAALIVAIVSSSFAWLSMRRLGSADLTDGARGSSTGDLRLRRGLIVVQVAVSFALVIGAGLLLRSLMLVEGVNPGMRIDHTLTARVALDFTRYKQATQITDFATRTLERIEAEPGVLAVAAAGAAPLSGALATAPLISEDRADHRQQSSVISASPAYFRVLGIALDRGRGFTNQDTADGLQVTVIGASLARALFAEADPIGRRISGDGGKHWITVVGVAADTRQQLDQEPGPVAYLPFAQSASGSPRFLIQTTGNPNDFVKTFANDVHAIDARQPVDQVATLDEIRDKALAPRRLLALMIGLLAGAALLMTATGLGGVISLSVNRRLREFGIRSALGATRGTIVASVVSEGMLLTGIGIAIGAAGALGLGDIVRSQLIGVTLHDPASYVTVALLVMAVAAASSFLPAQRAAGVDPARLFRQS